MTGSYVLKAIDTPSSPASSQTSPTTSLSASEKKSNLERALYDFATANAFFAAFLQEINISHDEQLPTAAIGYDKKQNEFRVMVNPNYFGSLTGEQRVAVLFHEVLHFTHGHLIRMGLTDVDLDKMTAEEKVQFKNETMIKNLAADLAINQYIKNLPDGCITLDTFKDEHGNRFPAYQTYEVYYDLINKNKDNQHNKDKFQEAETLVLDDHLWEQLTDEEKANMLKKAKEVTERTIEKTSREYGSGKDHVKDLMQMLETEMNRINYKQLLKMAIRRTVTKHNRDSTWTKPNRRYDVYAPGTREGQVPMLNIYIDTSGSISHTELNRFLKFIQGCLKAGSNTCNIGLWSDSLYHVEKFTKNTKAENLPIESGGTCVDTTLEHINKNNPDLAIILTDGYYPESKIPFKYKNIIWVISDSSGVSSHPHKSIGKTITLKGVIGG